MKAVSAVRLPAGQARYQAIDGARGIAALLVVGYHWNAIQPLGWIAAHGWVMVDFFFAISGAIFARTFADRITDRTIAGSTFFAGRIARLYPLHIVTLTAAVAVYALPGPKPFDADNSTFALALQVSGLQGFGPHAFNHPAWSITVEVACYALFFACCRARYRRLSFVALVIAGLVLMTALPNISRGLIGFFGGALAASASRRLALVMLSAAAASLVLLPASLAVGVLFPLTARILLDLPAPRPLRWLGDISYSLYLWDVPLQLLFASVALELGVEPALLPFLVTLLVVSALSRRWIEIPGQRSMIGAIPGLLPQAGRAGSRHAH